MIPAHKLIEAYRNAVFPMATSATGPIQWYSADPRGIIDLNDVHYPKRLLRVIRQQKYLVKINTAFEEVIRGCADRSDTWISEDIIKSFLQMHQLGHAHSVETWSLENGLIGGLYGVTQAGAFFGESMFHRATNASKIAFYHLIQHLKDKKFVLLDIQMLTPLTESFGAINITADEYKKRLEHALKFNRSFV